VFSNVCALSFPSALRRPVRADIADGTSKDNSAKRPLNDSLGSVVKRAMSNPQQSSGLPGNSPSMKNSESVLSMVHASGDASHKSGRRWVALSMMDCRKVSFTAGHFGNGFDAIGAAPPVGCHAVALEF
jgi:hypothetical protein